MSAAKGSVVIRCKALDCHNTITQPRRGRRKQFCSDDCRIRMHRCNETPFPAKGRPEVHPAELNAPRTLPAKKANFVTSKNNDLARPSDRASVSISGRGIVGPKRAIQAEVINSRDWDEIVSTDGVVSYVSRLTKPALMRKTLPEFSQSKLKPNQH